MLKLSNHLIFENNKQKLHRLVSDALQALLFHLVKFMLSFINDMQLT